MLSNRANYISFVVGGVEIGAFARLDQTVGVVRVRAALLLEPVVVLAAQEDDHRAQRIEHNVGAELGVEAVLDEAVPLHEQQIEQDAVEQVQVFALVLNINNKDTTLFLYVLFKY